jgi:hypothetical protein
MSTSAVTNRNLAYSLKPSCQILTVPCWSRCCVQNRVKKQCSSKYTACTPGCKACVLGSTGARASSVHGVSMWLPHLILYDVLCAGPCQAADGVCSAYIDPSKEQCSPATWKCAPYCGGYDGGACTGCVLGSSGKLHSVHWPAPSAGSLPFPHHDAAAVLLCFIGFVRRYWQARARRRTVCAPHTLTHRLNCAHTRRPSALVVDQCNWKDIVDDLTMPRFSSNPYFRMST